MRAIIATFAVLFSFIAVGNVAAQDQINAGNGGISAAEFRSLADSMPKLPGSIQAIRFFGAPRGQQGTSAALATFQKQAGWQILIFKSRSDQKFQLAWESGKLDDSFSVSSSDALKIFHLGNENAVEFNGCAPHVCPDVFSILLYVPSKGAAFTAKYVWGKVTYSPTLSTAADAQYKSALDQLVSEHRNQ
jgi:hypothetical protein